MYVYMYTYVSSHNSTTNNNNRTSNNRFKYTTHIIV